MSPPDPLARRLEGIGVRPAPGAAIEAHPGAGEPDLEATLLDAVAEATTGDPRLAALTLTWVHVHGSRVLVDKLRKLARARAREAGHATPGPAFPWLTAVASYALDHVPQGHKWRKLVERPPETLYLYAGKVTRSAVGRQGAIPWLERVDVVVPAGWLRIDQALVATPAELAAVHRQYRNRFLFGPSWRADIVTALEAGARTPAEIVRIVGCSYEPAHRVTRDWQVATGAAGGPTTAPAADAQRT